MNKNILKTIKMKISIPEKDIICVTNSNSKDHGESYHQEGFPTCCPNSQHAANDI